jgi:hypothetical protein
MIKLELTLDETNKVLEALGNQPYVKVADLVNKVVAQAEPQMKLKEEVETVEVEESKMPTSSHGKVKPSADGNESKVHTKHGITFEENTTRTAKKVRTTTTTHDAKPSSESVKDLVREHISDKEN